jgi:hypothetical protein
VVVRNKCKTLDQHHSMTAGKKKNVFGQVTYPPLPPPLLPLLCSNVSINTKLAPGNPNDTVVNT